MSWSLPGGASTSSRRSRRCTRHLSRSNLVLALLSILCVLGLMQTMLEKPWSFLSRPTPTLPPTYAAWHEAERAMPQNNALLPAPQGREGKYLRFATYVTSESSSIRMNWSLANRALTASGWGNVLQELVFHAQLAYESQRTYVHQLLKFYLILISSQICLLQLHI